MGVMDGVIQREREKAARKEGRGENTPPTRLVGFLVTLVLVVGICVFIFEYMSPEMRALVGWILVSLVSTLIVVAAYATYRKYGGPVRKKKPEDPKVKEGIEKPTPAPKVPGPERSSWLPQLAALAVIVAVGFAIAHYYEGLPDFGPRQRPTFTPAPAATVADLPADVALPIIARCESGGRQFDAEGNLVVNRETDDLGKYQINLPTHWERAESLDIDLFTEAGNEKFARLLYRENGTRDWNASRGCWEPRLLALVGSPNTAPVPTELRVEVGEEWTGYFSIPEDWGVRWAPEPRDAPFQVQLRSGEVVDYPRQENFHLTGDSSAVRFRSRKEEPVILRLNFVELD